MKKQSGYLFVWFLLSAFNAVVAQNVDPFTGSLNYGSGVFVVPSDRGNAIPINLGYGSNGIMVNQPSSDVGLGWNLSAGGSIYRSVNGFPDDVIGSKPNYGKQIFTQQRGVLFRPTNADILISKRNLDTLEFYYPNYDNYSVVGPGMSGSMSPLIMNYTAFTKDYNNEIGYDYFSNFDWKMPQFIFKGDFSDTLVSRHFPNQLTSNTNLPMPRDSVSGACYNDATSYYGKRGDGTGVNCAENYNPTTNRLATSNYVEYTLGTGTYKGIIAFVITNSNGFKYYYDLPVYTKSSTNYTYPLNNDYSLPKYTSSGVPDPKVTDGDNYFVIHSYPSPQTTNTNTFVTEYKDANVYVNEWKLTKITGPDYVDVNSNNVADDADKGYWVKFEYKLWNSNFTRRFPAYGYNFSYGLDENTKHYSIDDPYKRSGKMAVVNVTNEELYYLNSIATSSHKAIFIRDVRHDEPGCNPSYDSGLHDTVKVNQLEETRAWHGDLVDEGGVEYGYESYTNNVTKTIFLGDVSKVVLKFKQLLMSSANISGTYQSDKIRIYAGPNDTYPEVVLNASGTNYPSPYFNNPANSYAPNVPLNTDLVIDNYSATSITIKVEKVSKANGATVGNYQIEWHATGKKSPQLHLKRVLLFDKNYTLPAVTAITNTVSSFGIPTISTDIYNETWYQANKTNLDANSFKGVHLTQDYSLANKYHNNINVSLDFKKSKLTTQTFVNQNISITSNTLGTGKLTLNKIVKTELGGVQTEPSLVLNYNASNIDDNPDYNSLKLDYWGYYKSDASALGYYGYTTNTSKDYTDAWSLRRVTLPTGGNIDIEYESNSYSKVLTGKGGFRGASRIFPIQTITDTAPLKFTLEEGNSLLADLSEVYSATPPSGVTNEIHIPVNDVNSGYGYQSSNNLMITSGNFSYQYNSGSPLPIQPSSIELLGQTTMTNPIYTSVSVLGSLDPSTNIFLGFKYTGNGFVKFNFPQTATVYGGGARVKKITSRSGADAYSTLYEYEGGVATAEADRVANPQKKYQKHVQDFKVFDKLESAGDAYDMPPGIGYSKVKIKDLGQVNQATGWNEISFITSDVLDNGSFIENYKVNIAQKYQFTNNFNRISSLCSRVDSIYGVEYIDNFSNYWGLTKEEKVYDVNSNILSRNVYEYANTLQGALVENFVFAVQVKLPYTTSTPPSRFYFDPVCGCFVGVPIPPEYDICSPFTPFNTLYQVCIKRNYPVILSKSISYGIGGKSVSEILKRDEITGEALVTRITGDNNTTGLISKLPAFRLSNYSAMGPKSVNPSWDNVLGADAYNYMVADTNLTNGASAGINFSGVSASVYSKSAKIRQYNSGSGSFLSSVVTLPNWFNTSSYGWVGAVGSLDNFGLYKKSELVSYPFNYSSPETSDARWRLSSEITLMSESGVILETKAFNNKFSSTKLDLNNKYLVSTASNCNYESFTYTGFENMNANSFSDGEVYIPATTSLRIDVTQNLSFSSHTGNYIVQVNTAGAGPSYSIAFQGVGTGGEDIGLMRDRIYRASVWVNSNSSTTSRLVVNLNGTSGGNVINQTVSMSFNDPKAITVNGWKLLYVDIKVPADYTATGGTTNKLTTYLEVPSGNTQYGWFDDFQIHPIESSVAHKVYDSVNGRITADVNSEGYATKYFYDASGKVIDIYQEIPNVGLKLIKHNSYNFYRGTN